MFPNMDAIGIALARIYDLIERLTIAAERIAAIETSKLPADHPIRRADADRGE